MRYDFAGFELNESRRELKRGDAKIHVEPLVFDLLLLLVSNAGAIVSKDHMIEEVWAGRIVSEAAISARIAAARRAVGDDGKSQKIIRTIARRGLMLAADVVQNPTDVRPDIAEIGDRVDRNPRISIAPLTTSSENPFLNDASANIREGLLAAITLRSGVVAVALDNIEQAGRKADYVLRGRLSSRDARARAVISLVVAESAEIVWSDTFTGNAGDLTQFADEVVEQVGNALRVQINAHDGQRLTRTPEDSFTASELRSVAAQSFHKATFESHTDAERYIRRALAIDPEDAMSLSMLAYAITEPVHARYESVSKKDAAWIFDATNKAVRLAPKSDFALATRADMRNKVFGDIDGADNDVQEALKINPTYAWGLDTEGRVRFAQGDYSSAARSFGNAIQCDERDPWLPRRFFMKAFAHFLTGNLDEAVETIRTATNLRADSRAFWLLRSEILSAHDDPDGVQNALSQADRLPSIPDFHSMWINLPKEDRYRLERYKPKSGPK
jgi:adenylate cyclase